MKSLFKRRCPLCAQQFFKHFLLSPPLFQCPNCNGFLKLHFWRNWIFAIISMLAMFLEAEAMDWPKIGPVLVLTLVVIYLLHPLFVPVVVVSEEEGDPTEKKE